MNSGNFFAKNLKRLMEANNMNESDLAQKLGVTRASINYYTVDKRLPPIKKMHRMEKIFNLPENTLVGDGMRGLIDVGLSSITQNRSVPILKMSEIKDFLEEGLTPSKNKENFMEINNSSSKKAFCALVEGDAMCSLQDPKISLFQDDHVIFDPDQELQIGDIGVFEINEEYKIRQLQKDGETLILKALNQHYPIIKLDENVKIKGKMKEIRRSFD